MDRLTKLGLNQNANQTKGLVITSSWLPQTMEEETHAQTTRKLTVNKLVQVNLIKVESKLR